MAGLAAAAIAVSGLGAQALISVEDEIKIGREAQVEVRKQVPELADRQVADYVRDLGRQLARRTEGPKYPYSFSVADYAELNAFALPGGPVWVHRGILEAAENESQLVGVLAHEVSHIARRHAADQLTKSTVTSGLLGLLGAALGSDTGARTAQVAARLVAGGIFLKFSRDDEREADETGVVVMQRSGWHPQGMIGFFEVLRVRQGRDPGSVEVFFSTHPSPEDRIERLRARVPQLGGGRHDSRRFQDIQARLKRLPPAKRMPKR